MAQKTVVTLHDDLHAAAGQDVEAAETVRFGIDGTAYEIDLSAENAAALRASLEPFRDAGRKVAAASKNGSKPRNREDGPKIRAWARENGIDVPERGRIPGEVTERYDREHR